MFFLGSPYDWRNQNVYPIIYLFDLVFNSWFFFLTWVLFISDVDGLVLMFSMLRDRSIVFGGRWADMFSSLVMMMTMGFVCSVWQFKSFRSGILPCLSRLRHGVLLFELQLFLLLHEGVQLGHLLIWLFESIGHSFQCVFCRLARDDFGQHSKFPSDH